MYDQGTELLCTFCSLGSTDSQRADAVMLSSTPQEPHLLSPLQDHPPQGLVVYVFDQMGCVLLVLICVHLMISGIAHLPIDILTIQTQFFHCECVYMWCVHVVHITVWVHWPVHAHVRARGQH